MVENATFYSFKTSGKWYATGRGFLSPDVFQTFTTDSRRLRIIKDNNNTYPGLSSKGNDFAFVVIPDDSVSYGYPLMLKQTGVDL